MPTYVDSFLIPVPKKNLAAYKKMANMGKKIWMELGALSYIETVCDEAKPAFGIPFAKLLKLKPSEAAVIAFVTYKSKADRNRINKLVMKDPRMKMPKTMPFDMKRMVFGGSKALVEG